MPGVETRKTSNYKKKRYVKKGKAKGQDSYQNRQIKKLWREMKKNKPEMKVAMYEQYLAILTNLGFSASHLTDLPQGIAEDQRIGDVINLHRFIGRVQVEFRATAAGGAAGYQRFRLLLVQDTDPQEATLIPAISDIFEPFTGPILTTTMLKTRERSKRFTILWDKIGYVNNEVGCDKKMVTYDVNVKAGKRIHFRDNGAATANNIRYYFLAYADVGANGPLASWQVKSYYTDS